MDRLDSFERAFSAHVGTCRQTCACGKHYFDNANVVDWEPGELESLRQTAVPVEGSISLLEFEGNLYASNCECWKPRAKQIANFLDTHKAKIADYFLFEKKRLLAEIEQTPTIS